MSRPESSSGRQFASSVTSASGPPPGATRSSCGPVLEYSATQPCSVVAPTETTSWARAGYATARAASLPAAPTTSTPLLVGEAQRVEDVRDLPRADRLAELEREVEDVGAVPGRPADALGDRDGVALAVPVEHAHGHDLRAVGEAGHADRVVHALGDGRGDVRAVAVEVVRVLVAVDEVVAGHEAVAAQVGRADEAAAVGVGDARVEHRDDDARAAGPADRDEVVPGDAARSR